MVGAPFTAAARLALVLALGGACSPAPKGTTTAPPPVAPSASSAPTPLSSASAPREAAPPPDDPVATIAASEGVGIASGPAGHLGAWLALGPFRLTTTVADLAEWRPPIRDSKGIPDPTATVDDHALRPSLGATLPTRVDAFAKSAKDGKGTWNTAPATWTLVSSGEGAIDLERLFGSQGKPAVAYLAGVLRVPKRASLLLLVGSDDGCEVIVDGKSVFLRDASRPQRDDDDLVPLDLDVGDHTVVFKLRQRDGGWALRARLVDRTFRPPHGVRLLLPGATSDVAQTLARAMSWVRIVREPTSSGYAISTLVRYPEGAPLGTPLEAQGGVLEGTTDHVAMHPLGAVPIGPRAVAELRADIGELPAAIDDAKKTLTVRVDVRGRVVEGSLAPRAPVRLAIARARALSARTDLALADDVRATVEHLESRLSQQVARGDLDVKSQLADAAFLDAFVADAEAGADPIAKRTGVMRLAHVARADGQPQPVAVYVPKSLPKSEKKLPLFVGLHGMNGGPMAMLRVFFGGDDDKKSMAELDRGMGPTPPLGAFVIAPHAHGNAMYRQLGEEEVMDAIAWAKARWPQIDPDRVYLTGFSMGGIGAASIPLHHPDVFAAAQPLCGYHSYFIRRDVAGRPKRPWEQLLIEERSNVSWVDNGARLPLWIIHGTRDLPVENSDVLIEAYEKKGFTVKHDHPDLGHDVWGFAYDKLQHVSWFSGFKRAAHPKHVHLRTTRPRWGHDAWVHVDRLSAVDEWATVDARVVDGAHVTVATKGVDALHLDRDPALLKPASVTVTIDGTALTFAPGEPLSAQRDFGTWRAGAPAEPAAAPGSPGDGPRKEGNIAGPIRDVWNEPLQIVYGEGDPAQTQVNLEVARALATIRWGVDVRYPILKDSEVDPEVAPTRSTILVGNARSNRVLRALEPALPIRVNDSDGSIRFDGKTFTGSQLGAAFVVPHPKAKQHYLLVVEGADALGTFRALSLPELLPDFVIWDHRLAAARGQSLLAFGTVLSAGWFDTRWRPGKSFEDPLLKLPSAKSEKDATPYLP
ncbi:MAG: prolyl oligopeptidase family serine peptidase [Deltaproteobacteria bacterium]|nr:prolyl oligopeptidase family serine peptidase [Deltaproteobacteria bacterium]